MCIRPVVIMKLKKTSRNKSVRAVECNTFMMS